MQSEYVRASSSPCERGVVPLVSRASGSAYWTLLTAGHGPFTAGHGPFTAGHGPFTAGHGPCIPNGGSARIVCRWACTSTLMKPLANRLSPSTSSEEKCSEEALAAHLQHTKCIWLHECIGGACK